MLNLCLLYTSPSPRHNAQPVANGRCCDTCQDIYVLPTRMDLALSESPAFQMLLTLVRGQTK